MPSFAGRGVLVIDEVLTARDQVADAVHLLVARAVVLPAPALLAAAARVACREHAAALEPRQPDRREVRRRRRAVARVRADHGRMRAVERRVPIVQDRQRDRRAVGAGRLDFLGDDAVAGHGAGRLEPDRREPRALRVVAVVAAGMHPVLDANRDAVLQRIRDELVDRAVDRQRDRLRLAGPRPAKQPRPAGDEAHDVDRVARGRVVVQARIGILGDLDPRRCERGRGERDRDHPVIRRVLVRPHVQAIAVNRPACDRVG